MNSATQPMVPLYSVELPSFGMGDKLFGESGQLVVSLMHAGWLLAVSCHEVDIVRAVMDPFNSGAENQRHASDKTKNEVLIIKNKQVINEEYAEAKACVGQMARTSET